MSDSQPTRPTKADPIKRAPKPIKGQGSAGSTPKRISIIAEPAVIRRLSAQSVVESVTSNGTIAATVMVLAALLAVVVANSPAHEAVEHFLTAELSVGFGSFTMGMSLEAFINDFLMAIFFLLVGIELKYEVRVGQLRHPRQAALPMIAAVGGVAVPAIIYVILNLGKPTLGGWAIPIATDIAFS